MSGALGKDLLGLEFLTADQIRLILDTAEPFKEISERQIKKVPTLRGSTIVNLFFEASTRTRVELMEPATVDGQPRPPSDAPAPAGERKKVKGPSDGDAAIIREQE